VTCSNESRSWKGDIAKGAHDYVAHKHHSVSYEHISNVFLRLSCVLNDRQTTLVDEVSGAKHSCKATVSTVEE
jgi:hypothetical protein